MYGVFSDLSASKKKPALFVANFTGDNVIPSQITSVAKNDFNAGNLKLEDKLPIGKLRLRLYPFTSFSA